MSVWFVTRHPGAIDWLKSQGLSCDHCVEHLDMAAIRTGDIIIGLLPAHLAADICDRGAIYLHLSLDLKREQRGRELTAEEMSKAGARLEQLVVRRRPFPPL